MHQKELYAGVAPRADDHAPAGSGDGAGHEEWSRRMEKEGREEKKTKTENQDQSLFQKGC